jgi:hypothetical protein
MLVARVDQQGLDGAVVDGFQLDVLALDAGQLEQLLLGQFLRVDGEGGEEGEVAGGDEVEVQGLAEDEVEEVLVGLDDGEDVQQLANEVLVVVVVLVVLVLGGDVAPQHCEQRLLQGQLLYLVDAVQVLVYQFPNLELGVLVLGSLDARLPVLDEEGESQFQHLLVAVVYCFLECAEQQEVVVLVRHEVALLLLQVQGDHFEDELAGELSLVPLDEDLLVLVGVNAEEVLHEVGLLERGVRTAILEGVGEPPELPVVDLVEVFQQAGQVDVSDGLVERQERGKALEVPIELFDDGLGLLLFGPVLVPVEEDADDGLAEQRLVGEGQVLAEGEQADELKRLVLEEIEEEERALLVGQQLLHEADGLPVALEAVLRPLPQPQHSGHDAGHRVAHFLRACEVRQQSEEAGEAGAADHLRLRPLKQFVDVFAEQGHVVLEQLAGQELDLDLQAQDLLEGGVGEDAVEVEALCAVGQEEGEHFPDDVEGGLVAGEEEVEVVLEALDEVVPLAVLEEGQQFQHLPDVLTAYLGGQQRLLQSTLELAHQLPDLGVLLRLVEQHHRNVHQDRYL